MRCCLAFGSHLVAALIWISHSLAADEKAILEIAPTVVELGAGWTTNSVDSLIDPRSHPSEIGFDRKRNPMEMTALLRAGTKAVPGLGWGRFIYSRGDRVISVNIQRWANTNSLDQNWKRWKSRPEVGMRPGPSIGDEACLAGGESRQSLFFRRDAFHVIVSTDTASNVSAMIRLADVIDAKICGRPIPHVRTAAKPDSQE
jgi:hypothetical protein